MKKWIMVGIFGFGTYWFLTQGSRGLSTRVCQWPTFKLPLEFVQLTGDYGSYCSVLYLFLALVCAALAVITFLAYNPID